MTKNADPDVVHVSPRLFKPTEDQRFAVHRMAKCGLSQVRIAEAIINPETGRSIALNTLRAHFGATMAAARVEGDSEVAEMLLEHCKTSVRACMYWERTRRGIEPVMEGAQIPVAEAPSSTSASTGTVVDLSLDFARRAAFLLDQAGRRLSATPQSTLPST